MLSLASAAALGVTALVQTSALATTYVWNNTGTAWNNAADWNLGAGYPGSTGTTDIAVFNGPAGSFMPSLASSVSLAEFDFALANSSGYTVSSASSSVAFTLTSTGTGASSAIYANNSSGINTISAPLTAAAALTFTQATGGTLNIAGGMNASGTGQAVTLAGGGVFSFNTAAVNINGTGTGAVGGVLGVGTIASSPATLNITSTVTALDLEVGNGTGTSAGGAIYQTGGSLTLTDNTAGSGTGSSDRDISLGATGSTGTAGYGYYALSAGTLTTNQLDIGARAVGTVGVMDVSGGSATIGGNLNMGRGNGSGANYGGLNIIGGTVTMNALVPADTLGMGFTGTGAQVINIGGGTTAAQLTGGSSASSGIEFSVQAALENEVNLLPNGTLTIARIFGGVANATALVNFNGGVLKATAVNAGATFLATDIGAVTVYGNGGTIDNSGTNITIATPLLAPVGNGVTSIAPTGGAGYIGAPFVYISGGGGTGATAYAQMSGGTVSSFVITNPGTGYTSAPTITLVGGGATTFATATAGTPAANITTGGMTFVGSGMTTLTAVNTYTGLTTIGAGTLNLSGGTINGATNVSSGATLLLKAGTLNGGVSLLGSTSIFAGTGTLNAAYTQTVGTLAPGGVGVIGQMNLSSGATLSGGSLAVAIGSGLTSSLLNVTGNLNLTAPTALTVTTMTGAAAGTYDIINYTGSLTGSIANLTPPPSRTYSLSAATPNEILLTYNTAGAANLNWNSSSSGVWDVDTTPNWFNTATNSQDYFFQNDNVTFPDGAGLQTAITLNTTVTPGSVTVSASTNNYVISGTGSIAGAGGLTLNGTSTFTLATNNSYGATTINAGTLQIGVGGTTGSMGTGAVTNAGALVFNRSDGALVVSSNISGGGSLTQSGVGTITLTGSNTYTGKTTLNAGTLSLAGASNIGTGSIVFNSGTLAITGGGTLTNALVVNASGGTETGSAILTGPITGTGILTEGGIVQFAGDQSGFSGTLVGNGQTNFGLLGGTLNFNATTGIYTAPEGSPTAAYVSNMTVGTNGFIFALGGTYTVNLGSLSSPGYTDVRASNSNTSGSVSTPYGVVTLSVGALNTSTTFNGILANNTGTNTNTSNGNILGLTKVGTGELTLATNESTYTGPTIINGGILNLSINQTPDGVLYGTGFGGSITVNSGGELLISGSNDLNGYNNNTTLLTINGGLVTTANNISTSIGNVNLSGGTISSDGGDPLYGSYGFISGSTVNVLANSTISGTNMSGGALALNVASGVVLTLSGNFLMGGNIGKSNLTSTGPGTLLVTGNNSTDTGTFNIAAGSIVQVGNAAAVGALPVGPLSNSGILNFAANNTSGGILVRTIGALTINSGAFAAVSQASSSATRAVLVTPGLSLAGATGAWTGLLDLANNDLDVANGVIATLNNQVAMGYNGGTWNNTGGIVSSTAASRTKHLTSLGVIQNSVDGTTIGNPLYGNGTAMGLFDTLSPADTDVLVKYTYYGDTDLNGKVDGTDYSRIDNAYAYNLTNTVSPLTGWFNGDFNYDGLVNGSDYTLMDNAFNQQGAQISAQAATATALVAGGGSAVPEPATLSLLGFSAISLLGRRRHR